MGGPGPKQLGPCFRVAKIICEEFSPQKNTPRKSSRHCTFTLPETNSSHLKIGHPNGETSITTIHFQVRTVSFGECMFLLKLRCLNQWPLPSERGGSALKGCQDLQKSSIRESSNKNNFTRRDPGIRRRVL